MNRKLKSMVRIFTLLVTVFVLFGQLGFGQTYNNEWIRHNQSYYKFKVGKDGLFRISKALLDSAGIGTTAVENFELWKNGEAVPFYSSVASGPLPADGYLEFWGERNNGKPDRVLYRNPDYQHADVKSLFTDTAVYFLSINTNSSGFRFVNSTNDVASNVLPAETYFMHKTGYFPDMKERYNPGYAIVVGEYIYSSSFDKGEFWSSGEIRPGTSFIRSLANLFPYTTGPAATLQYGAMGNALNQRTVKLKVNNTDVKDTAMDFFSDIKTSVSFPATLLSTGVASMQFVNTSTVTTDRMVVSFAELTYPRQFNFGGLKNFPFELPARDAGYYFEVTNFSFGGIQPILYDITLGMRIPANTAVAGRLRFAIPGSSSNHKFVLVSQEAVNINPVSSLTKRDFVDYTNTGNQGDYMIISHQSLTQGTNGNNPIQDYKAYRESALGGSHNVRVYDIDELTDQFAYGIKKHPLSVKNFLRFARANFSKTPDFVFLIGRGVAYNEYTPKQNISDADKLNLIPSFGFPASDNMLSSDDGVSPTALTPIGRLSAVVPSEVETYLNKIIEYESTQANSANTLDGKRWMKNVVHVTGASDPYLGTVLCNYMGVYKQMIEDTLFGAKVSTFCKTTTNPGEQLANHRLEQLFKEGISFLNYFGHSGATTLDFNLNTPESYDNKGKYPVFFVNGCQAGNFFTYTPSRLLVKESLSEKFVLANEKGTIAFVASTHFGIVSYLNLYLNNLYGIIGKTDFGKGLGVIQRDALKQVIQTFGLEDFYSRMHAEQITLHGDPAIHLNIQFKPDYVIEEPQIFINPTFLSIAENTFNVKIKLHNVGQAIADSLNVLIKRQLPDGSWINLFSQKIKPTAFADSLTLKVPIIATRDKGQNRIQVELDPGSEVEEISETNNIASKDFFIFEDEARPVYPYNYSIIHDQGQRLYASTANPFSTQKDYVLEVDSTGSFNSPLKVSKQISSKGGLLEFNPGISYLDSTVYFWRVAIKPAQNEEYLWSNHSFMYREGTEVGFNQSHYDQHRNTSVSRIRLDSTTRQWTYEDHINTFFIINGMYPTAASLTSEFAVNINTHTQIRSACVGKSLVFNVFNPVTLEAWKNVDANGNNLFKSGSASANCDVSRNWNFEFQYTTASKRQLMMKFMDSIPDGYYVVVRSMDSDNPNSFSPTWQKDTLLYGSNNSLYHSLLAAGMMNVDSIDRPRAWIFMYKKNDHSFAPKYKNSNGIYDKIFVTADAITPDTLGFQESPVFGPSKEWKQVSWEGTDIGSPSSDKPTLSVVGIDGTGNESVLYNLDQSQKTYDISSVSASTYPYLKLRLRNSDSLGVTPFQLKYWRVYYEPVAEGAVAPNISFDVKDSLDFGEIMKVKLAFRNVSRKDFDSLAVKVTVLDKDNVPHDIAVPRQEPLQKGDTLILQVDVDTKTFPGTNTLHVDVNPDNDQPEQHHFNNFIFRNFYVRSDNLNPLLDVTFDGLHILNRDIVSARPHIQIKLKDEAKFLLLNDTALQTVQLKYPDGVVRTFHYDNDTLRFTPATNGTDNTSTVDFFPVFTQQYKAEGDDYELIVKGKDRNGNSAGTVEYRVNFKVITKPMISNLFNYPNPFTTSTAFVFTVTGSEVPQNLKIQILTVTGKIVREITKDELGPLRIGRNITEFKWDGTDQFGQRLANGVYLYRVVSTLNGQRMEKYRPEGDNTDRFFTNGYGKMYLMR